MSPELFAITTRSSRPSKDRDRGDALMDRFAENLDFATTVTIPVRAPSSVLPEEPMPQIRL